jgi:(3S)-malyl-CoA thioesterase
MRPYRSVLYLPASNARAMEKAADLPCDALILDLEDAVAPSEKPAARTALMQALAATDWGNRALIVRINGLDTPWGRADAEALARCIAQGVRVDGVLVPKVGSPADLDAVADLLSDADLWAMMETAEAMLNAGAIAAHPGLRGMVMGTNDLARELGSRPRPDRLPMMAGLGLCLLAARAHGRVIVDGVYSAFRDEAGLREECLQGRDMGFDGKTLIHPTQIAVANEVFAPSPEEIDLARRQISAFAAAEAAGQGVAVVDGRIVESLHIATARRMLDAATKIAAMA